MPLESFLIGFGCAGVNGLVSLWALSWAKSHSSDVFYWVWALGMLYRLVFFGVFALWLYFNPRFSFWIALLSMVTVQTVFLCLPSGGKEVVG